MLLVPAAAVFLLATQLLLTTNNRWFGTWKLNRALSHLTGPSITITRVPGGYHFDFGAISFDIGDDGKDYPTISSGSTSLKVIGAREWFRVHKVAGKEVDHSTLRITPDGKTLLIHTIATDVDGKTHQSDDTEERVGYGSGLAGTWRSNVAGINTPEMIVLEDAGEGRIRRKSPNEGQFYVAVPNGKPAPYKGPRSVPGVTVSLWTVSGTKMRWTDFINGRPYSRPGNRHVVGGREIVEGDDMADKSTRSIGKQGEDSCRSSKPQN